MAIGNKNSFMINARTGHKQHFIGTRQAIGIVPGRKNDKMRERLHNFSMRFASIGSTVKVYYLH